VKYFCACNKCFKVYQYKDSNGETLRYTKSIGAYPAMCGRFKKATVENTPVYPAESAAVKRRSLKPETESCRVLH